MTPGETEGRCLCCGKSLAGLPEIAQWHASCVRKFFGSPVIPEIDATAETLEKFARSAVASGMTVTGVQKKMSLRLEEKSGSKRLTLVGYPSGYIFKPPVAEYPDLPTLEHALMSLAEKAGIETVPHALVRTVSGQTGYITRRIDRISSAKGNTVRKRAMEDFCQLSLRLTEDKYKGSCEQCAKIIKAHSHRPGLDLADFFYLVLFNFASGNADMHLKNYSLIESDAGFRLSPAYDLVPTKLLIPEDAEESALAINGKKNKLSANDFLRFAHSIGLPEKAARNLIAKIRSLPSLLEKTDNIGFLPDHRRESLRQLVESRCKILE